MSKSHIFQNLPTVLKINSSVYFDLEIYPNPAHDEIAFNLPAELINKETKIEIYDAQGKLVLSRSVNDLQLATIYQRNIKLNNITDGLYILKLLSANGNLLSSKKFTVSN